MKTNRKQSQKKINKQIESLEPMVLMSATGADVEGDDSANDLVGQPGDSVDGRGGDDLISGIRDNELCGGEGDDRIITGAGHNTVDGHDGDDTLSYSTLNRSDVSIIVKDDGSLEISDGNKTDIVRNVENFEFKDYTTNLADIKADANNAPVIETDDHLSIEENKTVVGTIEASDADGEDLFFSLSDAQDSGLFEINRDTGELSFKVAPDFESPNSVNGTNVYDVTVRVTDCNTTTLKTFWVTVTDVDENGSQNSAPTFTNVPEGGQARVVEGVTFVDDVDGTDPDGDSVTYSIVGGDDSGLFDIDSSTGVVTFKTAPDFDNPQDADGNNVYSLTLRISDGSLHQDRNVTVKVLDDNQGGTNNHPFFTNVEQNEQVTVVEGNTLVGDADGTDPNGDSVTYSISGGVDASLFNIDSSTGVVTFKAAPDFDSPQDADGNNVYSLTLRISDGSLFQDRDITVKVLDDNQGGTNNHPFFTNVEQNEQVTVVEGNTLVGDADGTDPNGDSVTYSISGGVDASLFNINSSTGVVTFKAAPDFDNPQDADGNNVYSLTLRISDGSLFQDRDITVKVLDDNQGGTNNHPFFTNVEQNEQVTVVEGNTLVGDADGTDPNGDSVTYSISGGVDASLFNINSSTGVVTFKAAPDFDNPQDADGNNVYSLTLRISDGSLFQDRDITVKVLDDNQGGTNNHPFFTNVEQNEQVTVVEGNTLVGDADGTDPNGDSVTYSISGGVDASLFNINSSTGVVTFKAAPDFDNPQDADGNNVYSLTLRISDGSLFQDRDITVKVLDNNSQGGGNNAPFFTNVSQNEVLWHNENDTFVGDANASDADGDGLTFSIAGGPDGSFFQINAQTGQLFFINAPDFENPQDADGNNLYVVVLRVSDGQAFQDRTITVNVEDLANA